MPDHHIPLRPADLVRKLVDDPSLTDCERRQFRACCDLVRATIHHDFHTRLGALRAAYSPFDPDDDATRLFEFNAGELTSASQKFLDEFDALLVRANYQKLTRDQIERAIDSPSHSGLRLKLNLDAFEHLKVYVRGCCDLAQRNNRLWRRGASHRVPAYRRLAIVFRLKESSPSSEQNLARPIILKLFKDIPCEDIETLLPGANVRMGLLEQAQIIVPTVSGLGLTVFKLLKGAAVVALAEIYGLLAFLGLIGGAIGYGVKSFYSYLHAREKHQLSLTRNLYFQNLDNNAGVLYHLLAEAEDQEFREIVLAWWLLWRGGLAGSTSEQIDTAAERWLRDRCNIAADFEVSDALAKLHHLSLAYPSPSGLWHAISLDEALEALDRRWDDQFDHRLPRPATDEAPRLKIFRRAA